MVREQAQDSGIAQTAHRKWLATCIAATLLLSLILPWPARADWTHDVAGIATTASQGNYIAAEQLADQSLQRGPGGFLFGATGTLIIHQWRARLRLLSGDTKGAIADADVIIQGDSSYLPPDVGYSIRATSKALQGDAIGSEADFMTALKVAESGKMSRMRIYGSKGERAIARILLNDFAGAVQDLDEAISADHDTLLLSAYVDAKKESWTYLRQSIAPMELGDFDQAVTSIQAAIDALLKAGTETTGSDFLSLQMLLMRIETFMAEQKATR